MKDSDVMRVVAVELSCDNDKMRMNGTILITCNRDVPGTKKEVEDTVEKIGQCGTASADYPTDWEDTK